MSSKSEKKKRAAIRYNVGLSKYEIVREVGLDLGYTLCEDPDDRDWFVAYYQHLQHVFADDRRCSFLYFSDLAVPNEYVAALDIYQKVNHFPGMGEIRRV